MKTITYDNAYSTWNEALMVGNGRMGAMVYLTPESLVIDVNHYDIYYRTLGMYRRRAETGSGGRPRPSYPYTVEEVKARAMAAHEDPASPAHNNYNYVINPQSAEQYGVTRTGASQPLTAEMELRFHADLLPLSDFRQELDLDGGVYRLVTPKLSVEVLVSDDDRLLIGVEYDAPRASGGATTVEIRHPDRRLLRKASSFAAAGAGVFFTSTFPDHDSFAFTWRTVTDSAGATGASSASSAVLSVPGTPARFVVAGYLEPGNFARAEGDAVGDFDAVRARHLAAWREFWSASSVTLPDKMLERLWYVNLYSLRCCNGEGAGLYEQACGLNGLWDIKQPSQWGSMWYWDVNIQQAFWPIYTANHPELGRPFYDALESYIPVAVERAKSFYGIDGIAGDYPFTFYFCIWPWCAQYFWWHYLYTGDEDFLRSRAFPLFEGIIRFYAAFLTWNEGSGRYDLFPDIAPEQGPVTRNSTISISTLKFLLAAGVRASEILEADGAERAGWRHLLDHLPEYSEGDSEKYGRHIKDSEWAEPDIYMAHSSPLMVIYPIGEYSKRDPDKRDLLANTIRWMEHEQNLGTHNFGWLAAAYARLGDGDSALRMLHEKGIAYQMRTNGLFAEETERWIQNCLTACLPVYNPPLIEAGSAVVAAVNEMLLQSFGGRIEVFPAVPRGTARTENARYDMSAMAGQVRTPEWADCRFDNFRAEGGFLVSAELSEGTVTFVEVGSERGGPLTLINPFPPDRRAVCRTDEGADVQFRTDNGLIFVDTAAGRRYRFEGGGGKRTRAAAAGVGPVLSIMTPERRRAFLGKDRDTDFRRTLDGMTHDYFAGDQRVSPIAVYRFDFSTGADALSKDYRDVLERQFHGCGKMGLDILRVTTTTGFTTQRGYGFEPGDGELTYVDRTLPDPFRRDFIQGSSPGSFLVELARGTYRILVVSGDASAETDTVVTVGGTVRTVGGTVRSAPRTTLRAGEYHFEVLPVNHAEDGCLRIALESRTAAPWKLNMMVVNRVP